MRSYRLPYRYTSCSLFQNKKEEKKMQVRKRGRWRQETKITGTSSQKSETKANKSYRRTGKRKRSYMSEERRDYLNIADTRRSGEEARSVNEQISNPQILGGWTCLRFETFARFAIEQLTFGILVRQLLELASLSRWRTLVDWSEEIVIVCYVSLEKWCTFRHVRCCFRACLV